MSDKWYIVPMCSRLLDDSCALNFDLPYSVWEYSPRMDRIARAGRGGRTFVCASALKVW